MRSYIKGHQVQMILSVGLRLLYIISLSVAEFAHRLNPYPVPWEDHITKIRLFKYIENFTSKN